VRLPQSTFGILAPLAVSLAAALLVYVAPALRTPRRLFAVGFVATALMHRGAMPAYVLLSAGVYVLARHLAAERNGPPMARWRRFVTLIVALAVVFVLARAWHAERYGPTLVGVSWPVFFLDMFMLLRLVSFLWETGSGRVKEPAALTYALWSVLPFTIFGPLLRFSEFQAQLPRLYAPESRSGFGDLAWWRRIALASTQIVLATLMAMALPWSDTSGLAGVLTRTLLLAPWSFYLLASGTMTIMECLARAWGLVLPRSFDRAFIRPNISEFWANWNMSATALFRDYLFYNRWGRRTVNVYANVVVLFFLVGLWHDSTPYWMIWGLLHGFGFAAFLYYKKWKTTPAGARVVTLPRPLAIATTYLFVCACWAAPPQVMKLLSKLT
jgi:D-alanyl-lipoteichoic acid acyltransferase DltB (MBOAT superfamily)